MKAIAIKDSEIITNVKRDDAGMITGGFLLEDTFMQDQELLLLSFPGDIKARPLLGIGLANYLQDDDNKVDELHASIVNQYAMLGFTIKKLSGKTAAATKIEAER